MNVYELARSFRENYMIIRLRPTTIYGYDVNINNHILPLLAPYDLAELTPDLIDDLTDKLRSEGLSNKTIVYVHATFRKMLNYALKRGFVKINVYSCVDLPKVEKYSYHVLDAPELKLLLSASARTSLEIPVTLACCYGLRRGEILGIRYSDFSPSDGVLHVQRTKTYVRNNVYETPCKTDNGDRYILIRPEHLRYFRDPHGEYLVPYSSYVLNTRFKRLSDSLGFSPLRFHDLRHSYATLMMKSGVNPKIVSSVLGHSDVSVTLDIYSHPDVTVQSVCHEAIKKAGL